GTRSPSYSPVDIAKLPQRSHLLLRVVRAPVENQALRCHRQRREIDVFQLPVKGEHGQAVSVLDGFLQTCRRLDAEKRPSSIDIYERIVDPPLGAGLAQCLDGRSAE